jgi:hypothetical protein
VGPALGLAPLADQRLRSDTRCRRRPTRKKTRRVSPLICAQLLLSRIPLVTVHLLGARIGVAEAGADHGWSAWGCGDGGSHFGVGAFGASRRGGPSSGHSVARKRLDQRADRPAFGVTPDSVRRWRTWLLCGGFDRRTAPVPLTAVNANSNRLSVHSDCTLSVEDW